MPLAGSGTDQAADSVEAFSGTVSVKLAGIDGAVNRSKKS